MDIETLITEHKSLSQHIKKQLNNIILKDGKRVAIIPVPEEQLPVLLPEIDDYTPPGDGRSPYIKREGK